MNTSIPRSRSRLGWPSGLAALFAFAMVASLPSAASAQGRCSCNSGCHQYPGQCVQPGSSGCEAGYAPFCATRAESCPRAGWVSCGGTCTCVRVTPVDAGVPDAGRVDVPATLDVPVSIDLGVATDAPVSVDVRPPTDIPASMDAPVGSDVPVSRDAPPGGDVPASFDVRPPLDAPPGADGSTLDRPTTPTDSPVVVFDGAAVADAPPGVDAVAPSSDAAVSTDGCVCEGGACVAGVCYRERCTFHPELGFICATAGTSCRLFDASPICVPLCAGVSCPEGQFCDERSNGACVADRCASFQCPIGTTCVRNQCGRWGGADGGIFIPEDGGTSASEDGGTSAPPTATDDGCGCRAGQVGGGGGAWGALLLGLLGLKGRRRQRSRSIT